MKSKIILYLDDTSRSMIKTNVSSFVSKGVAFISNLNEITDSLLEDTNKVVLLEGIFKQMNCYSDLKLYKGLLNLEYFYIGLNKEWLGWMENIAVCYRADITTLNFEVLQSAVFGDRSFEVQNEHNILDDSVTQVRALLREEKISDPNVLNVMHSFLSLADREQHLQEQLRTLRSRNQLLENENLSLKKSNYSLLCGYKQLIKEAVNLNKTLKQYEVAFTTNVYQKINLHNYSERPLIIYLKEYEELLNLDSLIETLFDVFRIQEKKSVKVLRLYDNSSNCKIKTLPSYYKVLLNKYQTRDVLANDYLCKTGDYVKVLDTILLNKTNLDVLIIVDCKDFEDVVVSGTVLQLNTCRNKEHLAPLGLLEENTIVNDSAEENPNLLCWENYNVKNLSKEDRFIYLSSRPLIQQVLQLSRTFSEAL